MKCCQRTKPQSYSVLLQLPPPQLTSVFERCPEMRDPLLQHVLSFTPHQVRALSRYLCSMGEFSLIFYGFFWHFLFFFVRATTVFLLQQAHIPASIMEVLEVNKKEEPKPEEAAVEKEVTDKCWFRRPDMLTFSSQNVLISFCLLTFV